MKQTPKNPLTVSSGRMYPTSLQLLSFLLLFQVLDKNTSIPLVVAAQNRQFRVSVGGSLEGTELVAVTDQISLSISLGLGIVS